MLKRIANVLWLLGLLLGGLATAPQLYKAYENIRCSDVFALQAEIERTESDAQNAFRARLANRGYHRPGQTGTAPIDELDAQLDSSANARKDKRDTAEHQQYLGVCKASRNGGIVLFGWIFALAAWALAYTLGGSSWKPSKKMPNS